MDGSRFSLVMFDLSAQRVWSVPGSHQELWAGLRLMVPTISKVLIL